MGVGSGGRAPLWIFIQGTYKVKGVLMALFFVFFFISVDSPWKFFCQSPWLWRSTGAIEKRGKADIGRKFTLRHI